MQPQMLTVEERVLGGDRQTGALREHTLEMRSEARRLHAAVGQLLAELPDER